jgi:hypothetical protein
VITVACVQVGNYCGRGAEYVNKLRAAVNRNLLVPHRFECITESDKPGWFAKCDLFKPGLFSGRVLYLDLDTLIVGSLDRLVLNKGILHLRYWGWRRNDYGSGVMVWDAGEHEEIFKLYDSTVPQRFKGDQDWIRHCGEWPALPTGLNVSYRYHCKSGPDSGASTISFHGSPKPHEFPAEHWVTRAWG